MNILMTLILSLITIHLSCGRSANRDRAGSCSVEKNADNTSTLKCDDGTSTIITNGKDGTNGTSCSANRFTTYRDPISNGVVSRGGVTIICPGSDPLFVLDGIQGPAGKDGTPAPNVFSCTITDPPSTEGSQQYTYFQCIDKNGKSQSFLIPRNRAA